MTVRCDHDPSPVRTDATADAMNATRRAAAGRRRSNAAAATAASRIAIAVRSAAAGSGRAMVKLANNI